MALTADLLVRSITYRLQEQALGRLQIEHRKELDQIAGIGAKPSSKPKRAGPLRAGSRLVRRWRGTTYSVTVLDGAFEFRDQRYGSLSEIAREITAQLGQVRRGNDVRILIRASSPTPAKPRNEELVHMLADARAVQHLVLSKPHHTLADLARSAGRSERVFKRMLRLSYLSPSIVQAILEGDQPPSLTVRGLHQISSIPIAWDEQRRFFQFD